MGDSADQNGQTDLDGMTRTVATLRIHMRELDTRLRVTQLVGAAILLLASWTAPVLVAVSEEDGEHLEDSKNLWSSLGWLRGLISEESDSYGSHASHMIVFWSLVLTSVLCVAMLLGALGISGGWQLKTLQIWQVMTVLTAMMPIVTLIGLGLSTTEDVPGGTEMVATWTTLAPTALGAWVLSGLSEA